MVEVLDLEKKPLANDDRFSGTSRFSAARDDMSRLTADDMSKGPDNERDNGCCTLSLWW